ncbi:hypothetical protein FWK35_00030793 [Aphis craccivora]|uniref:Uncharacterized protein n=1 Tax=Aphis craccivora TaxID=307492 RepID=A0A6G0W2B4_APHCR|nr:hypothetical protein FWK35_00030793 [Aphis craccivora]
MLQFQTLGVISDVKRSKINIFQQFSKKLRKTKKNDGKTRIFTQNQFSTKLIFLYGYKSKKAGKWVPLCCTLGAVWITIYCRTLNL